MSKHADEIDAVLRSKYAPLYQHLCDCSGREWHADFAGIERILGFRLPRSAREHRAWWSNEREGSHVHARAWLVAGWETREVNQERGRLVFKRIGGSR